MPATRSAIISVFIISCLVSLAAITFYLNYGSTQCHKGSFLCHESDVCIPNKYKCNRYRDCIHGEDEDPLACADLRGGLDVYNKAVKFSKPKFNKPCGLRGYPDKCVCKNETWLRCNDAELTEMPRTVSNNLEKIALNNNRVKLLADSFAGYQSLTSIAMGHNGLSKIPPLVFRNQSKLRVLILQKNNLNTLEENTFFGLDNVVILFLDSNYLVYLNLHSWRHMAGLNWLDLSDNLLTFEKENFPFLRNLSTLYLHGNRIETISERLFSELTNLEILWLHNNLITTIHKNAFQNTIHLRNLSINNNRITTISPELLHPLKLLDKLTIGYNPIERITGVIFMKMENLTSLEMNGISKERIEMSLFDNLTSLQFLYLKEFHYCALYAKHVPVCLPNKDGLSSGLNLLPNRFIRWICWTVTGFTFVMNALVLYGRMFRSLSDENPAINFVIRNLAVADMFMVIYLMVVGYRDREYENNYYAHAHEWESSRLCTVTGIMAVISSEVSMLILVFISLERFLLIAVPLSGYRVLKLKTAVCCMASIWLVGITISIAPLVLWKHSSKFYGSNGFCYPLYIEDPFVDGWQYSAFMFLGLHVFSLLLMSILYALMFISVRKTRQAARISAGDFDFAVRFFFIVLANSFCWLPVIVLKIAALKKFHISSSTYGWVIIFIVPINAWVNPLLYTFTTPKYRKIITLKNMFKTHRENRKTIKRYSISETPHSSNVVPLKKTPPYPNNSPRKPQEKTQNEKTTTVDPLPTYRQINNNNANSTRENSFETTVAE